MWVRPSLVAHKMRRLALQAGAAPSRGQRGSAHDYYVKSLRDKELAWIETAEHAYDRFVKHWQPKPPPRESIAG